MGEIKNCAMRRHITIWIALLAVAATAAAQYPGELYGVPAQEGCMDVQAYVTQFIDHEPWSVPDPTGHIFWLGELCAEPGTVSLDFDTMAWRICRGLPWGSPAGGEECFAWFANTLDHDSHLMAWNGDETSGFYMASVYDGELWIFDTLTVAEDGSMTFRMGAFEFVPPLWYGISDARSLWVMDVAPLEVELRGHPPKATRRLR